MTVTQTTEIRHTPRSDREAARNPAHSPRRTGPDQLRALAETLRERNPRSLTLRWLVVPLSLCIHRPSQSTRGRNVFFARTNWHRPAPMTIRGLRRPILACTLIWPALMGADLVSAHVPLSGIAAGDEPCSRAWLNDLNQVGADEALFHTGFTPMGESYDAGANLSTFGTSAFPAATTPLGSEGGELSGLSANTLPNDFIFQNGGQNSIRRINVPEAWEVTFGRKEVTIAVIADGVSGAAVSEGLGALATTDSGAPTGVRG